jgi:hypothetical protein
MAPLVGGVGRGRLSAQQREGVGERLLALAEARRSPSRVAFSMRTRSTSRSVANPALARAA